MDNRKKKKTCTVKVQSKFESDSNRTLVKEGKNETKLLQFGDKGIIQFL